MPTTATTGMYPQPVPTISGAQLTVSVFLQNPVRVQRTIEQLSYNRFIADVLFSPGPNAPGGSVLYDQLLAGEFFLATDVQDIEPGSQFPLLDAGAHTPLVALIKKWGGEVPLTYEAVDRDNRNLLDRQMKRLRNTIVRKVDSVSMAAMLASPLNTIAATDTWLTGTARDIIADVATAVATIDALDMGYEADSAFITPMQHLAMTKDKDVRTALPREGAENPIASGHLGSFMGLDWFRSNRVTDPLVGQRGIVGNISDEVPLYAKPINSERDETWYLHGARRVVPYVTDPKSFVRILGS